MHIGELARLTGLSIDTLRWYEKIGLLAPPLRDAGGRRVYPPETPARIGFLVRLRTTGMSVADVRAYARLREAGNATTAQRRARLEAHRAHVLAEIATLEEAVAVLDRQIAAYRDVEERLERTPGTDEEACPLAVAARPRGRRPAAAK